ncbi:MAG: bifunctional lysylphosphatidylglycerol synthetase/lysine--tRNA ligase LysX [Micrococcales bacterium]|nr:bifunctional lysylphosphatidylglycerol synthetase/lysine--tRNA ligase LysX [Micrococcales bacterium]
MLATTNNGPRSADWRLAVAVWAARVVSLAALWALLAWPLARLLPAVYQVGAVVMDTLNLPAHASLFNGLALSVLAVALRHRKRAAMWAVIWLLEAPAIIYGTLLVVAWLAGAGVHRLRPSAVVLEGIADPTWRTLLAALIGAGLVVLLILSRQAFTARLQKTALRRGLATALGGLAVAVAWAFAWATALRPHAIGAWGRLGWAINVAMGQAPNDMVMGQIPADWRPGVSESVNQTTVAPAWVGQTTLVIALFALLVALAVVLQSSSQLRWMNATEELAVRRLLLLYGAQDSMGYFNTKRDKAVVFSPDGQAAVVGRLVGQTLLASGDPVGNRSSWAEAVRGWLDKARSNGWTPAVIAATPRGGEAYQAFGLRALAIGDEAVLEVDRYSLRDPRLADVARAVRRSKRAGYTAMVRRQADVPADELAEIVLKADAWRRHGDERNFSMGSGRLGDPSDGRNLIVTVCDAAGHLRGLLSFAPWGRDGASLDVMRHDPSAEGGTLELMITAMVEASRDLGVKRLSLNFAALRRIISQGSQIGAFPIGRLSYRLVLFASRWVQIESLYRANEKFGPIWRPRVLCYDSGASFAEVMVAVGRAEGLFPDKPLSEYLRQLRRRPIPARRLQRLARRVTPPPTTSPDAVSWDDQANGQVEELLKALASEQPLTPKPKAVLTGIDQIQDGPATFEAFVLAVQADEAAAVEQAAPQAKVTDQTRARRLHREALFRAWIAPNPLAVPRTAAIGEVVARGESEQAVSVVGRVLRKRDHGGLCFVDLRQGTEEIQAMVERRLVNQAARPQDFATWVRHVQAGDLVSVTGPVIRTRSGQLTIEVTRWDMAAKSLVPMPTKRRDPVASPALARTAHLQLATHNQPFEMISHRAAITLALRQGLERRGFIEVETPILQPIHGGARARPFRTHINAYDQELFLRIAPELYLKRLAAGGVERLFELGRSFRNEGVDRRHNPEFTSLEAYQAFADYTDMRHLTQDLLRQAAMAVHGEAVAVAPDGLRFDLSGEWPVFTVYHAVSAATETKIGPDTAIDSLRQLAGRHGLTIGQDLLAGEIVNQLYCQLVEPETRQPTFFYDFPIECAPLARRHRHDSRLAERWDLVAFGMEIGTANSELTDPIDERTRLTAQSIKAAAGDPEAMMLDQDFLAALDFGLPPLGGLGLGVDRIIMMLTGVNIRQTLSFPFAQNP